MAVAIQQFGMSERQACKLVNLDRSSYRYEPAPDQNAHYPTDENFVVVSGALTFGMGDKLPPDAHGNKTLSAGGFALMPANAGFE